jgi:hypothetical protein
MKAIESLVEDKHSEDSDRSEKASRKSDSDNG